MSWYGYKVAKKCDVMFSCLNSTSCGKNCITAIRVVQENILRKFVIVEGEEVGRAEMTAVQQPPMTGDAGLRWDANMVDSDLDEFEDDESNSAKLFERSRIRALAGMF